jgi:hypothetical protein
VISAVCTVWLLTATCADDVLWWDSMPAGTVVCVTWAGQTSCLPEPPHQIGCYSGTLRIVGRDEAGSESEPLYLPWAADPGRAMEWIGPCSLHPLSGPGCAVGCS